MRGGRILLLVLVGLTVVMAGCPGDGGDSGYARSDEPGGLDEFVPIAGDRAPHVSAFPSTIDVRPAS